MNDNWVFGDSCLVSFNNLSNPVATTIAKDFSSENNCSISDSSGNLLFYLSGAVGWSFSSRIYNRLQQLMLNGDSIFTDYSETNGSLIIPFPDSSNLFLMFHLGYQMGGSILEEDLYYSIIDMNLDSGNGAVVSKNNLLMVDSMTEKLCAIKHGNGIDWWVISHMFSNNAFYIYHVTPAGVSQPIIQNIGSINGINVNSYFGGTGEMVASPNGDKIVCVNGEGVKELFDFDRCSGTLSNCVALSNSDVYYGCSFSPNGKVLYVSSFDASGTGSIYQYDLTATNISSSKFTLYSLNNNQYSIGQHELGPDNKIYITTLYPNFPSAVFDTLNMFLSVINSPDSLNTACNFTPQSFYLGGNRSYYGLPNNPNYELGLLIGSSCDSLPPAVNFTTSDTSFCEKNCIDFFDFSSNNPTSWQWFFPGADSTTSMLQNPTNICYNSYGSFDVTLIACNSVGCDTLVLPGFINEYPLPVPVITQSNDTLFSSPGVAYQWWSVDSGIILGANNSYYIPTQNGNYYVIVTDSIGCVAPSNVLTYTGISSLLQQHIEVSPNPVTNTLIVKLNSNETLQIIIYDITSRKLLTQQFTYTVTINTEQFAKGLYIYELRNKNVVIKKGKVVKE